MAKVVAPDGTTAPFERADDLPAGRLEAGAEYCDALDRLGLDIRGAVWMFDFDLDHHVLFLYSDLFDYAGPAKIAQSLFRAYKSSADFEKIDPFHVVVRSSRSPWWKGLSDAINDRPARIEKFMQGHKNDEILVDEIRNGSLSFQAEWVVRKPQVMKKKRPTLVLSRRWKRFESNIDELQAAA